VNKKSANPAEADVNSKTIADLKRAIEELVSGRKKPQELEGIIAEAKSLAYEWKDPKSAEKLKDRRPLFRETSASNTAFLLAALVGALMSDHRLVESIRRNYPDELEKLREKSRWADALTWAAKQPQPSSKKKYEHKRRKWNRSFFKSMEYQFGGGLEAESQKGLLLPNDPVHKSDVSRMQDCLDDIVAGDTVNMSRLEDLFFGIDRHRLGKLLSSEDDKGSSEDDKGSSEDDKGRYDHRSVVKIMDALLSQKPRQKRKRSKPGRPQRPPWLNNDVQRAYVLAGVAARIHGIEADRWEKVLSENDVATADAYERNVREWKRKIANSFLDVIRSHLPDSGKK
jgi:hypothetical protein